MSGISPDVHNYAVIMGSKDIESIKQQAVIENLFKLAGVSQEAYNQAVIDNYLAERIEQIKAEAIEEFKASHAGDYISPERIKQLKEEAIEEFKTSPEGEDIFAKSRKAKQELTGHLTAYFVSQAVSGIEPKNINRTYNNKEYTLRAVYRLIQVRSDEDRDRIMKVYETIPKEFTVSERDLENWIATKLRSVRGVVVSENADEWGE